MKLIRRAERYEAAKRVAVLKDAMQSCGDVHIAPSVVITDPAWVAIGNNVSIGEDSFFFTEGGLQIQDNVRVSRRVTIYSSDHAFRGADEPLPFGAKRVWRQVVIERNAWIGMNVCILPGVRIGEGAIIGMGAVVAKDVQPGAIVGQQPYRELGARDAAEYRSREARQLHGEPSGRLVTATRRATFRPRGCDIALPITFVATAGRSGSTTIVDALATAPDVDARHEPRRQLIQWSTELAHGEIDATEIRARLAQLYLDTSTFPPGKCIVESDQKTFNLLTTLANVIPTARFIWLTRRAEAVVAPTAGRGWYAEDGHLVKAVIPPFYHQYRVTGAGTGEVSKEAWGAMTAFEKNCWYWSYVNRTIRSEVSRIDRDRWTHVHLEDLDARLADIQRFVGCRVTVREGASRRSNAAFYQRRDPSAWSDAERAAFERWCAPLMAELYPDDAPTPAPKDREVAA